MDEQAKRIAESAARWIAFLAARLDEDDAWAKAAGRPEGVSRTHWLAAYGTVVDAGDPDWAIFTDTLPEMAVHIALHDPASVRLRVDADRLLLDVYRDLLREKEVHDAAVAEYAAATEQEERTGEWPLPGEPGTQQRALQREGDYLGAMIPVIRGQVAARAAVWSDHPDYPAAEKAAT